MNKGKVFLIGAGPGDPSLLTCRAKQLLSECDVVCYDKLVSAAILASIPKHVELHQVGYRGYKHCGIDYGMHPDVVTYALAGKNVARLKAGDPCIFGRTTEECRELIDNDIAYEIVPGITAALGASAYSGFPLTSGGIASSVTFVSGHQHLKSMESWSELDNSAGTVVLYMGAKKLKEHAKSLIENGRNPNTSVALISSATSADHQCITGTLENIGERVNRYTHAGPALVVIGEVVSLAKELNWRQHLLLSGKRFLLCGQHNEIDYLKKNGAEVISVSELPTDSFIDEEDLAFFLNQQELAFDSLPAFKVWWQAMRTFKWDIRQFTMPLCSDDEFVINELAEYGINAKPVSKQSMILTLEYEKVFEPQNNYYQIGRRHSQALGYQLPAVDWVLVEDFRIAESILHYHSQALSDAKFVPLSERSKLWAVDKGYLSKSAADLQSSESYHVNLTEPECINVA